jgi:hypothetical protein
MELIKRDRPSEPIGFRLTTTAAAKVRKFAADNGVTISDVVISALVAVGVLTREDA